MIVLDTLELLMLELTLLYALDYSLAFAPLFFLKPISSIYIIFSYLLSVTFFSGFVN